MNNPIEGLKPELVWKYFHEISQIPRGSKNEAAIAKYVVDTAARLGLQAQQDAIGNVVVRKPATPGRAQTPSVCLQGHLDMVCEKNSDKVHDFHKDPIEIVRKGNTLMANGTTLGADNGIAVATNLALMEDTTLEHGPLEFLFTIDEETGLTGAANLDPKVLQSRTLLNLDSEEEGALYVGCAGGRDTIGTWKADLEKPDEDSLAMKVTVRGLRGGHSGLDIDKGRGNAIKIINRVVLELSDLGARLSSMDGGNKHNAIPREAAAVLFIPKKKMGKAEKLVGELNATLKAEISTVDPDLSITLSTASGLGKEKVFSKGFQEQLCRTLAALPHGVIKMSADIPGLVESSTNLAIIKTEKKSVEVSTSQRSSVASEIIELAYSVNSTLKLGGATVKHSSGYPGWKPNMSSPVLEVARSSYRGLYGKDPAIKAIHAGLECGIIGDIYPEMDMISFGPTLEGVHSPDEKIYIDTVEKYFDLLLAILKNVG